LKSASITDDTPNDELIARQHCQVLSKVIHKYFRGHCRVIQGRKSKGTSIREGMDDIEIQKFPGLHRDPINRETNIFVMPKYPYKLSSCRVALLP
jgi:hypothetical protein